MSAATLVEHFFRREYARAVARLTHRIGAQHLGAVEDAVQCALMSALESWTVGGIPENPSAWVYRVAQNTLLGELRRQSRRNRLLDLSVTEGSWSHSEAPALLDEPDEDDDLLRMLFVCCDEAIPTQSQLVFALKTLCGFSIREIAFRLSLTEANVYKRLARARDRLREMPWRPDEITSHQYAARLPAVQRVLYVLFTEGHLSSHPESAVRRELCAEAIRLCTVLASRPVGQTPETFALLALMHFHAARATARQDVNGGLLLLEEQDRALWDTTAIGIGLQWLARSATGNTYSRYHAEAGVAVEHCLAPSLAETRWERVVACYTLLEQVAPSAVHTLNRAVALAEWQGAPAGLELLNSSKQSSWLAGSYMWFAVLADLHGRCGDAQTSQRFRTLALDAAPTPAVRTSLHRRLAITSRV